MKTDTLRKGRALAAGLTLMTAVLATAAMAQGPGGGGFGGPPPGGFGGGGPGGFGGPGGGPGGFGGGRGGFGRAPFAFGAISAVDTNAGTITITSQFGGNGGNGGSNSQVIKIGAGAQVISQTDTTVADLKIGDQVQVQGVPTGITASQLTVGTPPAGLPGAGGFGGGRFGGPGGGGAGGGNNAGGAAAAQGFATATGKIASLPTATDAHLSITLGPDVQLFLKMAAGAKITRYTTLRLTDLKVGDQIMAMGQTGDDGTLTASTVGVNMPMMRGGFGGGFGGGGFGGGFGGGGFGGGRGGRNRRGGGGGFGGGQNGGGPNGGGGGQNGGGFGGGGGNGGPPPPGPNDGNGPPPPAPGDGGGMIQ